MRPFLGLALSVAALTIGFGINGCDGDDTVDPNPRRDSGTADATVEGGAANGDAGGTDPNSLCAKYGGFANVEAMVKAILDAAKADCKISAFFSGLALTESQHLQDCLSIQLGEIMGCGGKVYAGSSDTLGQACRSMAEAHQLDTSVSSDDFDAFVIDLIAALKAKGMSSDDIAKIAPSFQSTKGDVVQTGDQGYSQSACPAQDAGQEAGLDGSVDAGQDTGVLDASDGG